MSMGSLLELLPMREPLKALCRVRVKESSVRGRATAEGSRKPKPHLELGVWAIRLGRVGRSPVWAVRKARKSWLAAAMPATKGESQLKRPCSGGGVTGAL